MGLNLQDDMADIFLNSGFEEDIVYTPDGGTAKTISAIVSREGEKQAENRGRSLMGAPGKREDVTIEISTDATDGIASVSVNTDKVTFSVRPGDSETRTMVVSGILYSDAGAWGLILS